MECEAAVVGEQGGEGDQVRPLAVPVLLKHVAGGGEEEGGAAAAWAAGVSGVVVVAVSADQAVQRAGAVQLLGLTQTERQSHRLERLRRCQSHQGAVTPATSAAPPSTTKQELVLALP